MPTLDRTALLKHLDDVLDEDAVVALLFDLHLDRTKLWPRKVSKYECLINLIEHYERRDAYPALVTAVAEFLARQKLPPLPSSVRLAPSPQPLTPVRHNLPRRTPHFTGRADLLAALSHHLAPGPQPLAPVALHGLGGIGKTQLALEYAHRHLADYDLVAWLRAEDGATLASDLAALAVPLALPQAADPDQRMVVAAVLRWLDGHGRWLLVYDNAVDRDTVRPYLPQAGAGHTLITSRHRHWAGVAHALDVPVLPRPDAVAFLLGRTGQTDRGAADTLADALGDLPLALEQAAAYIDDAGISLAAYLTRFQTRRADLLRRGRAATGYPDTVWTTWDLSIEAARRANPASADLLTLCAFFAPDDIPVSVIRQGADHLPEPLAAAGRDDLAFDDAVAPLRHLSLLDRADDSLTVHRLVQAVTRDHLTDETCAAWASAAVTLLDGAFPGGDVTKDLAAWPVCARLVPHVVAATEYAEGMEAASEAAVNVLNQATNYPRLRAQYSAALPLAQRALRIAETALDPDHPDTATFLDNLAGVLHAQGNLTVARSLVERALAIRAKALGPDHPATATSLSNLAAILNDMGNYSAACPLLERALTICEKVLGPDHPDTASSLNNLAYALEGLGDLAAARAHYERALAIREKAFGPDHPDTATSLNNLAGVLHAQGDLPAARAYLERGLAIYEKVLGPDHPHTATFLNGLATVFRAQDDLPAARAHLERALAIHEKVLGPDHPSTATSLNNLATVLHDQGEPKAARVLHERALAIRERVLGPDHPDTAQSLNNLAVLLKAQGDLAAARPLYERAIRIAEKALGKDHPTTQLYRDNLAYLNLFRNLFRR